MIPRFNRAQWGRRRVLIFLAKNWLGRSDKDLNPQPSDPGSDKFEGEQLRCAQLEPKGEGLALPMAQIVAVPPTDHMVAGVADDRPAVGKAVAG